MSKERELTIEDILALIPEGVTAPEARDLVRRAYEFAEQAHRGQIRKSGEPYIQHPIHVAWLLAQLHLEPAVIAAGLLHDVLEDCDVTRQQLEERFDHEILVMVDGVTKLESVENRVKQSSNRPRDLQELESLRKMLIAMAVDDIRIIFIKLADRLHNMRTLKYLSPEAQKRIARETLEIFAPLANRLGIWTWKAELEDLSFRYLNPPMYQELKKLLAARKDQRQAQVEAIMAELRKALEREGIKAVIKGRPKHIYSIYNKMRRKNIPFSKIYDTQGVRVIVDTEPQCYQVLGIVHRLWRPVPGEFDDYIANPKPNGYQSLHTAVVGRNGGTFEIQIRTHEMDHVAEYGVAAHWLYKEQGVAVDQQTIEQIARLRQSVQELTQDAADARAFINSMRSSLATDRVLVFTPKGKVINLPQGATPIDFAYYVHTEIGHRCRGAWVNGKWVPLDYTLQMGDIVEIAVGRNSGPSRDWLNEELGFVKTPRARQKIRQWFRRQSRRENVERGRAIVERSLKRLGLEMPIDEVALLFSKRYHGTEDFLAAVGTGDVSVESVISRLEEYIRRQREDGKLTEELAEELPSPPKEEAEGPMVDGISIQGTGGLLTHIARCCKPLPGEEIIGYVTRGRGVTIHRRDCPNILNLSEEDRKRLIEVAWGHLPKNQTFPTKIVITAYDRARLLHDISGVLTSANINMLSVATGKRDRYNMLPIYITMEVPDFPTLDKVLVKIEQLHNVVEARRVR